MDEMLLDDYAFEGLDPFVRTVFSELMEHPEWMRVVDREHCVEKVVRFEDWGVSEDGAWEKEW